MKGWTVETQATCPRAVIRSTAAHRIQVSLLAQLWRAKRLRVSRTAACRELGRPARELALGYPQQLEGRERMHLAEEVDSLAARQFSSGGKMGEAFDPSTSEVLTGVALLGRSDRP